jgi:hypothetical protein
MWQPRIGVAWDVKGDGKSLVRSSWGVYYARQNMLSQVGSVTTNGLQQQTIFANTQNLLDFGAPTPTWPNIVTPAPLPDGEFPLFSGVRVFDRDYKNPYVLAFNVAYEQQLATDWAGYVDFIWNEGKDLTRFLNYNRSGPVCCVDGPGTGNSYAYTGKPWGLQLDEVMVTNSRGSSTYRGLTLGVRKRLSNGFQLEGNYVLLRHPARILGQHARPVSRPAADHRQPAQPQWPRSRPQRRAEGQRVLLLRLAFGPAVPVRRALRDHADPGDVQHVQQRQQHQPAVHAAALRLLGLPPHRRRRPATGAAGGEDDVLRAP